MKGNFNQLINADRPVLIDFHAEWCGPCKMQTPVLKEASSALGEKVKIIKIDVDKNPEIASRYQVRGVPTLILFKEGQPVWRQSGLVDKQKLMNTVIEYA